MQDLRSVADGVIDDPRAVDGLIDSRDPNLKPFHEINFGRIQEGLRRLSERGLREFNTLNENAYNGVFLRHRMLSEQISTSESIGSPRCPSSVAGKW